MLKNLKTNDIIFENDMYIIKVQYIMKIKYNGQSIVNLDNLIGTSKHPIYDENQNSWIYLKYAENAIKYDSYNGDYLYSVSTIKILKNGTIKKMPYIILNGIKCATFGHNQLDKDEDDEHYTILCSTFWGNRILSIFDILNEKKLLNNNVLTLYDNYKFIRNDKGWCIGIELDGIEYY